MEGLLRLGTQGTANVAQAFTSLALSRPTLLGSAHAGRLLHLQRFGAQELANLGWDAMATSMTGLVLSGFVTADGGLFEDTTQEKTEATPATEG